jgi:hypothetical protein
MLFILLGLITFEVAHEVITAPPPQKSQTVITTDIPLPQR